VLTFVLCANTVENQEWQRAVQLAVNPIHLHQNSHLSPRFQFDDVLDSPAMSHVVPAPLLPGMV